VTVSGRREQDKRTKGLAIKKHRKFTAHVPYINSHIVEVIARVHWHTGVFTKNPEVRHGKPHFDQRGKPNKNQRQSKPNNTTLLFLKIPIF
jgi:hypothetical protein